jgi:predicted HTH transcriptional regulator
MTISAEMLNLIGELEQKIAREKTLHLDLPLLSATIISLLSKHSRLTISQLEKLTKANRNTLKKHLAKLVKDSQIICHGQGRGTWYTF